MEDRGSGRAAACSAAMPPPLCRRETGRSARQDGYRIAARQVPRGAAELSMCAEATPAPYRHAKVTLRFPRRAECAHRSTSPPDTNPLQRDRDGTSGTQVGLPRWCLLCGAERRSRLCWQPDIVSAFFVAHPWVPRCWAWGSLVAAIIYPANHTHGL